MIGNIGYVKNKDISDKEIKRVNMQRMEFSSNEPDFDNAITLDNKTITREAIDNFSKRKEIIEKIINEAITKEKYTVVIDLENVDVEEKKLERFSIELMPRLREIGGCLYLTNNRILSDEFLSKSTF